MDSSVAAHLLLEAGYEVTGVTLPLLDGVRVAYGHRRPAHLLFTPTCATPRG